jgi:hypothetical protein
MGTSMRHGTCAVGEHARLGQAHLVVCMREVPRHSIPQHLQHVTILCDQPQFRLNLFKLHIYTQPRLQQCSRRSCDLPAHLLQ